MTEVNSVIVTWKPYFEAESVVYGFVAKYFLNFVDCLEISDLESCPVPSNS